MKYVKKLTVAGNEVKIVSESAVLDLAGPGRAVFAVQADRPAAGDLVRFSLGLDGEAAPWLSGYVESCRRIDSRQWRLVVREYSALLARRWTVSQRHTSAARVLAELSRLTGIAFRLGPGAAAWKETPIAYFFNLGSGYEALELIGKHLQIPDFVWMNQPDGTVFVGSGSELAGAETVLAIPERFFTGLSAAGADCPLLPALRPGRRIRIGDSDPVRIESITLQGEKMRINFQC